MTLIDHLFSMFGYVKKSNAIPVTLVDAMHSVEKRVDEHRELAEYIAKHSNILLTHPWVLGHIESMDEYLLALNGAVQGSSFSDRNVDRNVRIRPFPEALLAQAHYQPIRAIRPQWVEISNIGEITENSVSAYTFTFTFENHIPKWVAVLLLSLYFDDVNITDYDENKGIGNALSLSIIPDTGRFAIKVNLES